MAGGSSLFQQTQDSRHTGFFFCIPIFFFNLSWAKLHFFFFFSFALFNGGTGQTDRGSGSGPDGGFGSVSDVWTANVARNVICRSEYRDCTIGEFLFRLTPL